jgi:hypothetical protein
MKTRRRFAAEFKAKAALEAINGAADDRGAAENFATCGPGWGEEEFHEGVEVLEGADRPCLKAG